MTEGVDVVGIQTHSVKEDANFNGTIGNMSRDRGCGCGRDPDTLG